MPANIDAAARKRRRKEAVQGTITTALFRIGVAAVCFWLRAGRDPAAFSAKVLLIVAIVNLGTIIPLWISLQTRLKEIEGGEEDAAAEY